MDRTHAHDFLSNFYAIPNIDNYVSKNCTKLSPGEFVKETDLFLLSDKTETKYIIPFAGITSDSASVCTATAKSGQKCKVLVKIYQKSVLQAQPPAETLEDFESMVKNKSCGGFSGVPTLTEFLDFDQFLFVVMPHTNMNLFYLIPDIKSYLSKNCAQLSADEDDESDLILSSDKTQNTYHFSFEEAAPEGASVGTVYRRSYYVSQTNGSAKSIAVKVYSKVDINQMPQLYGAENPLHEFETMVEIKKKGGHAHLITMIEVIDFEDKIYLIMPLASGGDLWDMIKDEPPLPNGLKHLSESRVRSLMIQIVNGLQFLHSVVGRAHRDLTTENIMLTEDGICIIIDYGMSLRSDEGVLVPVPSSRFGKPNYIPPEVFRRCRLVNFKQGEMWSLGTVLCALLTGSYPCNNPGASTDLIYAAIAAGKTKRLIKSWRADLSEGALNLLDKLLQPDPSRRPASMEAVLADPWMATAPEGP